MQARDESVLVGRIQGVWGAAGWVKVYSLTQPPENIFEYQPWQRVGAPGLIRVSQWRRQGPRLVARLEGVDDRDAAEALVGTGLAVDRAALPETGKQQFYWSDLIGLEVVNRESVVLGRVRGLIDAGVHDVLEIRPEPVAVPGTGTDSGSEPVLVPFVPGRFIDGVDLDVGRIRVDWQPDW